MKYCIYCGTELSDDAGFCTNCGKQVGVQAAQPVQPVQQDDHQALKTIIYVFYVISTVMLAISTLCISLAWCLPMMRRVRERMDANVPVGMALKVCTLLFVNTVAGILLLVLDDGS